jgi:Na+-driven multidrug efflux pump
MLGASEEVLPYIVEYMQPWYWAILFVVIPFVGNSAIRATGDALTPSLIMFFAVVINAILDPLLIFGYGPFPALGIGGAAYATAISRGMTMPFYGALSCRLCLRLWQNLLEHYLPTARK